jgi:hypothetical protein
LRVVDFLGPGGPGGPGGADERGIGWVWVRGLLLDARGVPGRILQLCVPLDQSRAVPANRVRRPGTRDAVGIAPVAARRVDAASSAGGASAYVTGPDGRQYRRVDFPTNRGR